jgi:hypothetical protein
VALDTSDKAATAALRVTPRWYACRDAARLHLGSSYTARMSELGKALVNAAKAANCDVLQAARTAARNAEGLDAMQLLAAAVEVLEPST